jgi:hypothetical protein
MGQVVAGNPLWRLSFLVYGDDDAVFNLDGDVPAQTRATAVDQPADFYQATSLHSVSPGKRMRKLISQRPAGLLSRQL